MQNFNARNIIFEGPALLNFNYLPEHTHTHTQDAPACASAFQQKCLCRYFAQLWMIFRQAEIFFACLCFIGFVCEFSNSLYDSAHRDYVCGNKVQKRISGCKRYFCSYWI